MSSTLAGSFSYNDVHYAKRYAKCKQINEGGNKSKAGEVHDIYDEYIGCLFGSESIMQMTDRSDLTLLPAAPRKLNRG